MRSRLAVLLALCVASTFSCRPTVSDGDGEAPLNRGWLTVGIEAEPLTWNRLLATDRVTHLVTERLHAALVRIDRVTQEVEPELAQSWSFSADGRELTFRLRPNVRFSDGTPFTAEDVAFTFRAVHDPDVASPLVETATLDGQPLSPEVIDPLTVRFRLPRRTAAIERIFDSIAILPRHRLEEALERGRFAETLGMGAAVEDVVGLGPFVLADYRPGQRVVLSRNPYYWKSTPCGPLPLLEGIVFEILGSSTRAVLRLLSGELDVLDRLASEDFLELKERAPATVRLLDLGPGLKSEWLWLNLNPRSPLSEWKRQWFSDVRFRRALSLAVDREVMVEAVYHGLATPSPGVVSPGNAHWVDPTLSAPSPDREKARVLLSMAGFRWDGTGALHGPEGQPVRFSLATTGDDPHRLQMAQIVQEDLARLGIEVYLLSLDSAQLLERIGRSFDYEACLFGIAWTDPDPSAMLPLWLSRSPLHVWSPSQEVARTPWEARVDELMVRQMSTLEPDRRKALFDEVQQIAARELPVIGLVNPHVVLAVSRRVRHLEPAPFPHPVLWNSEEIALTEGICKK